MRSILSARIAVCQCRPGASLQITSGHVPPLKKKKRERKSVDAANHRGSHPYIYEYVQIQILREKKINLFTSDLCIIRR